MLWCWVSCGTPDTGQQEILSPERISSGLSEQGYPDSVESLPTDAAVLEVYRFTEHKEPHESEQIHDPSALPTDNETTCTPGQNRRCYPGDPATQDQGLCRAGTQTCDLGGQWGPCRDAVLPQPEQCNGVDDDCNGWVDDIAHCVHTIAGNGSAGYQEGTGKQAQFNSPADLVVSPEGIVYVTDTINQRIRRIDRKGQVSTYAGDGTPGSQDGERTVARFYNPGALALGEDGTLYVADTVNHRIRKITPQGQVMTWAGSQLGLRDGIGTQAKFYFPSSLAVDRSGRAFVADTLNHAIRKIEPDGTVTTLAGNGDAGYQDGLGQEVRWNMPLGIALGLQNHLLIADSVNNMIRGFSPEGRSSHIAGEGIRGFRDGPAQQARFYQPPGIATDDKGNIYVADTANQRIRKISSSGQVSTIAGTGVRGLQDGMATTQAQLFGPTGIAVGPHNRLYFTDFNSHTVRVLQLPR